MKSFISISFTLLLTIFSVSSQSWKTSDSLCNILLERADYVSALDYAEEYAAIVRGTNGENGLNYADALNKLAVSHYYLGNFVKARYYSSKELSLREKLKEDNNSHYIRALENSILINIKLSNFEDALSQAKKAEKIALRIYGSDNPEYASVLGVYGGVYNDMGSSENDLVFLKQADEYFTKAENIYRKVSERYRKESIVNNSNHGSYNNNIGNTPLAESIFAEVIESSRQAYGLTSDTYATALNNIGVFYFKNGNFKQAEKFFIQAVEIYKQGNYAGKIQAAICINNLGALYNEVGNYKSASNLLSEAQNLFEIKRLIGHPDYAVLINNVAAIKLSGEYYASSENKDEQQLIDCGMKLLRADSIFSLNSALPNPDGFDIKNNVSLWYKMKGDTAKSILIMKNLTVESNLSLRVIASINKMSSLGEVSWKDVPDPYASLEPEMISIKINTADQLIDDKQAEENLKSQSASTRFILNLVVGKATNIKKALGPYHPAYANMLKSLIPLYVSIGSDNTVEEMTLEYINVISHNTLQDFSFLSESEKEMYYQTRLPDWHSFMGYVLKRKIKNPNITAYAYNFILQNKGLMLKSSTAMRLAIQNSGDSALLRKYDRWLTLQKEISILYSTPVDIRKEDVSELENQANILEKSLVENSQQFGDYRKGMQISWKDVRGSLKSDEAAIEFTNFRQKASGGGFNTIYCALILKPGSPYPDMLKLFDERELTAIIGKDAENNQNHVNSVYGSRSNPDNRLYKLIWQPLEVYLDGVKRVYMSPSGLLFKISFAALNTGKNIYLCDKYELQIKGNTGNTVKENIFSGSEKISALVFGGINYGGDSSGEPMWNYLSGTKEEGDAVHNILANEKVSVNYLSGNKATETYLKKNGGNYNILHVATHGFFFSDPNESKFKDKEEIVESATVDFRGAKMRGFGVRSFVNNLNPLMRSGLVFSGANEVWDKLEMTEEDDGVLTAQEVTQIDMRKNFLVVLSACETGLGDIKGSEGVYGLQRAFKMAGVKFIISSLWQVPDKETVEFMELFYTNLLKIKEIRTAFSLTQEAMRQKYDPYSWGAFVLME